MSNWMQKDDEEFKKGLREFYNRVILWNTIAGNTDKPRECLVDIYTKLVEEERKELLEAYDAKDAKGFLKELADCLVVGSFLFYVEDDGDQQLLNLSGIEEDDIEYLVTADHRFLDYAMDLGRYEDLAYSVDANMIGVLHEVMDSNFSKFVSVHEAVTGGSVRKSEYAEGVPTSGQSRGGDLSQVCKQIEENSEGRYTGVTSRECNGYIVFRDDKGKIMKPPSYREADVRRFVPSKWL